MINDNNHKEPVDQLFRQSLGAYSPAPPPGAWKKINAHLGKGGSWYAGLLKNPFGLSALSVAFLGITAWFIYKSYYQDENVQIHQATDTVAAIEGAAAIDAPGILKQAGTSLPLQNTKVNETTNKAYTTAGAIKPAAHPNVPRHLPDLASRRQGKTGETSQTASATAGDHDSLSQILTLTSKPGDDKSAVNAGQTTVIRDSDTAETKPAATGNQVSDSIKPINPADLNNTGRPGANPGDTITAGASPEPPAGGGLSGKPKGNLLFNAAMSGNYGKVIQKGRAAMDWYGAELNTGVWLPSIKGGVSTGIGLQKFRDEGSFIFDYQTNDTTGIKIDTIWNFQDSIPTFGTVITYLTDSTVNTEELTSPFSYTYLNIPLYLTKQIFSSGKLSVNLKFGPSVAFLVAKNEPVPQFIPPSGILKSTANNSYQRLKTSWQLLAAPGISYQLTPNLRLFAEPSVTWFINNLYDRKRRPASTPFGLSIHGGIQFTVR